MLISGMGFFIETMPKYLPKTEKLKAQALLKPLIKNGLNQSKTARELGVSQATIQEKFHRKPVQDCLQKFLSSKKLKKALVEVAIDGLKSERSTGAAILVQKDGTVLKADEEGGIMIPDQNARHKYWHDLMMASGVLKTNGNGHSPVIIIQYGYRTAHPPVSLRAETGAIEPS